MRLFIFLFIGSWFVDFAFAFRLYDGKNGGSGITTCFDHHRPLRELERYADFIITGTVERLLPSENDYNLYIGIIRPRRIFKDPNRRSRRRRFMQYRGANGNITVLNFGDPMICRTEVKPKDTKIFFLSAVSNHRFDETSQFPAAFTTLPRYVLNSSVIPLTLRNLDLVEAAVKGWPAKHRKPLKPEACERKLCAFGGVCKINATSLRPYCDCVFNCDNVLFAPVCGSDNFTYSNDCWLRLKSCTLQRRIRVKLRTACDVKNPCDSVKCQFGAKCQVSIDGKNAHCVCPQKCYRYGDSQGSRPVCGDDGRTYDSQCHLELESCRSNKEITIRYTGLCDPCANVTCPDSTVCKLNPMREPICRCSEQCPLDYNPVCASDGRTYQNTCIMRIQECKLSRELRVVYNNACEKEKNPCHGLKCEYGQECFIDAFGRATCECLHRCEPVVRPVCGKDGVTYDNECELYKTSCQKKIRNAVDHKGPCGIGACVEHACTVPGTICVLKKGLPVCQCPACNEDFDPVCGSNGITYANECKMRQESCEMKKNIFVKYGGFCNGCKNKVCDNYAVCVADDKGQATCRCPVVDECPKLRDLICGIDGVTYENECHLKVAACQKNEFIVANTKGPCDACSGVQCQWGSRCENGRCVCPKECPIASEGDEVCGSDGLLYPSECLMQARACAKGMKMTVMERDRCSDEVVNVEQIGGTCECNRIGAKSNECDNTGQCRCKPGVGGRKCDQCQPGFWGLHLIPKGNTGCQPCGCSAFGSDRDDCEQTTGRCVCKPGVKSSMKCDECEDGLVLRPQGCVELTSLQQPTSCEDTQCYFGAKCQMQGGRPECLCPDHCAIPAPAYSGEEAKMEVCGSNGVDYGSACQLRQFACRLQIDVVVVALGACTARDPIASKPFKTARGLVTAENQNENLSITSTTPATSEGNGERIVSGSGEDEDERDPDLTLPKNQQAKNGNDLAVTTNEQAKNGEDPTAPKNEQTKNGDENALAKNGFSNNGLANNESPENELEPTEDHQSIKPADVDTALLPSQPPERERHVGDACMEDLDCSILGNSFCTEHISHKICLCRRGYVPSHNQTDCVAVSNQIEPCAQQPYPCQNGGSCLDDDTEPMGGYRCLCPRGYNGKQCEKKTGKNYLYSVPGFNGHSWMEFNRMDAYTDVSIEMELLPHDTEGIVLYNGQKEDDKGDFISLALIGGFVEFRYNLGDGIIVLKSHQKVQTDKWHRIVAGRIGQHGRLIVDKSEPVTVSALTVLGSNTHLNLRRNMYLGKVPRMPKYILQTVGTSQAYSGCILSLKINGKIYDLRQGVSVDVMKAHNVGECGINPCSSLPCLNGGTCVQRSDTDYACVCDRLFTGSSCETSQDSCASQPCKYGGTCRPVPDGSMPFTCICPQGRTGTYCENTRKHRHLKYHVPMPVTSQMNAHTEDVDVASVAEFHGNGYVEMRPFAAEAERVLSIIIWLMPYKPNGLLLFSGNVNDIRGYGGGDFVSLALLDGRVQFLFNLGSGIVNITSHKSLNIGKWHTIKAYRHLRNGSLKIDHEDAQQAMAPPPWDKLNLESLPVFIGGTRNSKLLKSLTGAETGFYGAVQRVSFNGIPSENLIKESLFVSAVGKYEGPPCVPSPCRNGGSCVPKLDQFDCVCVPGFNGLQCEKETAQADADEIGPVAFDGRTFLKFRNRVIHSLEGQQESSYVFRLRTNASDGLILWENRGLTLRGDYLAIALDKGRVVVSFNLGKETIPLEMRSENEVNDADWHVVRFWRSKRQAYLSVDEDESPSMIISSPGATELNTDGYLWLGGSHRLPTGLPPYYYNGYAGCMDGVTIDGRHLHLTRHQVKPSRQRLTPCHS